MSKLLNAVEVSLLINTTVPTINMWYKWKRLNPEHEMAKLLPDYQTVGNKRTRYWDSEDIGKLIEFKAALPQGRNGILGSVTQQYVKKEKKQ